MQPKLNLIAAACSNGGIGNKGNLPWRLKSEMAYFTQMTTKTSDASKQNAVIMGRKTWDSIPLKYRPLSDRINIVLSKQNLNVGDEAKVCNSLDHAMEVIKSPDVSNKIENVWVIGGSAIYEMTMKSLFCHRVYLTDVMADFECDTFFPTIDHSQFKLVTDPDVPQDVQVENGISFKYQIYEKYIQ